MAIVPHFYSDEPQLTTIADTDVLSIEHDGGYYYAEKSDFLSEHENRLDTLEGDVSTEGSVLKDIKDNAEDAIFTPSGTIEATDIKGAIAELDSDISDLAGDGRTTETVKQNADDIADLAGAGRSTETVKQNADDIADHESRIVVLESSRVHRYGMKMNKTTGVATRTYEAVGKVYRQQIDTITTPSDFSYLYPWSGIITVKVDADKNILCTINDTSFSTTVGDTMVLIPVFWSRYDTDDDYEYIDIADAPINGFKAEGFYNPDGTIKPYALVAATFTSNDGSTPHSWTDTPFKINHPLYSATSGFQLDALNKSATNPWSNIDASTLEMLVRLSAVEICGSTNSASGYNVKGAIGQGINGLGNSYSASNVCTVATTDAHTFIMAKTRSQYFSVGMLVQIGTAYTNANIAANRYITDISEYDATNDTITVDGAVFTTTTSSTIATWGQPLPETQLLALKNESGYVLQWGAENKSHVCYRGIWDLWGNQWCFLSGLYRYDLEFYRAWDITKMNVNDPRGVAGWSATGIAPDIANGYLKNRQKYSGELGEIGLPLSTGGDAGSTTYWGAYNYYFNSTYMGLRAVLFGGNWFYGVIVSPLYWFGNNAPTNSDITFGGRLIG